ncbi:MAG: hypothetical protein HZA58_04440 [Acidimicrobiia bacterium]|nr:hypothetical protein [Acidimicrobiia bacterium]
MEPLALPAILPEFEPTRATLHAYALVVGAVPRAHAERLPHWWHAGMLLSPEGLATAPVPLPDGATLRLHLDLVRHEIVVAVGDDVVEHLDMRRGVPATALAAELFAVTARLGLADDYDRLRFENDDPRPYDPVAARTYHAAFSAAETVLARHRAWLEGRAAGNGLGAIHVWPHHFDMSFEWYGDREVVLEGESYPSQLNLGFDPTWEPYFYSNPWPLDPSLVGSPLPHGAMWHTDGWQGTLLPYENVRRGNAVVMVTDFARAVFELAEPTL